MFLRILSSLQSFLFELSAVKISKVTSSHFGTILAQIGPFFFIFDPLVFRQSSYSEKSPEYTENTDVL